jgi:hypothetical protein
MEDADTQLVLHLLIVLEPLTVGNPILSILSEPGLTSKLWAALSLIHQIFKKKR